MRRSLGIISGSLSLKDRAFVCVTGRFAGKIDGFS
jgi:hypothetical protein